MRLEACLSLRSKGIVGLMPVPLMPSLSAELTKPFARALAEGYLELELVEDEDDIHPSQ